MLKFRSGSLQFGSLVKKHKVLRSSEICHLLVTTTDCGLLVRIIFYNERSCKSVNIFKELENVFIVCCLDSFIIE
jgi:hypothetical protein